MSLFDTINKDFIQARRDRNETAKNILNVLISDLKYIKINEQLDELDDSIVIKSIQKSVKQKSDTIEEAKKGGRDDMAESLQSEIDFLSQYLPEMLSEDKLREIALQVKQETGASSPADMGKMMKGIMPLVKGRADGSVIKNIVMDILK